MMSEDSSYIFVYGTLRDGSVNHMAHFLKENTTLIGSAFIYARLYKITWYPAIVLDASKSHKVYGEIYRLHEANKEAVIHEIDGYEGIYESNEDSEEYERVITMADLGEGNLIECWVYNFKASIENVEWVESGDFLKYLSKSRN